MKFIDLMKENYVFGLIVSVLLFAMVGIIAQFFYEELLLKPRLCPTCYRPLENRTSCWDHCDNSKMTQLTRIHISKFDDWRQRKEAFL